MTTRQTSRAAGFSLIEMVLALALVALIVGIGAIGFASGKDERLLTEASSRLEAMSSRGHAMSILHQKPFWLRIEPDRVVLAGPDISAPIADDGFEDAWEEEYVEDPEAMAEIVYDEFSTEALVLLRRWGAPDDEWLEANKDRSIIWQFQSTGLCEPISLRVEKDRSWIVMHMHPLTARVEEEEMSIE